MCLARRHSDHQTPVPIYQLQPLKLSIEPDRDGIQIVDRSDVLIRRAIQCTARHHDFRVQVLGPEIGQSKFQRLGMRRDVQHARKSDWNIGAGFEKGRGLENLGIADRVPNHSAAAMVE